MMTHSATISGLQPRSAQNATMAAAHEAYLLGTKPPRFEEDEDGTFTIQIAARDQTDLALLLAACSDALI